MKFRTLAIGGFIAAVAIAFGSVVFFGSHSQGPEKKAAAAPAEIAEMKKAGLKNLAEAFKAFTAKPKVVPVAPASPTPIVPPPPAAVADPVTIQLAYVQEGCPDVGYIRKDVEFWLATKSPADLIAWVKAGCRSAAAVPPRPAPVTAPPDADPEPEKEVQVANRPRPKTVSSKLSAKSLKKLEEVGREMHGDLPPDAKSYRIEIGKKPTEPCPSGWEQVSVKKAGRVTGRRWRCPM